LSKLIDIYFVIRREREPFIEQRMVENITLKWTVIIYFWMYNVWNILTDFRGTEDQTAANLKKVDRLVAEIALLKVM